MPAVSDTAEAALAAERPNIFSSPNGPRELDAGGAARRAAEGIFAATARPLPGFPLGRERGGQSVRRVARASMRSRASVGARLLAGALAVSLTAALLIPRGHQALPSRSRHEVRRAP